MQTVDGTYGTAKPYLHSKNQKKLDVMYRNIVMKYKIMKFRMKISYVAFEKIKTVKEMFLETIMKQYMSLFKNCVIPISTKEFISQ